MSTPLGPPLPLPIRILVKGASTVGWLSGMGGPRTDFIFPRALEAELLREGRPVELRTISVPSERAKTTLRHWEHEMIGFSPDVVVLVYGHYEAVHLFLPWWLERHANSLKARPHWLVRLYRKRVLRPLWMWLAKTQSKLDQTIDPTIRRRRPKQVAADIEELIGHTQELASPLVFVFELMPPASRFQSWFPGMAARIAVMNDAMQAMVKRVDKSNVRWFRVAGLVDAMAGGDLDVATPDGFHYSPELHRVVGETLAHEIAAWADTQPHLGGDGSA